MGMSSSQARLLTLTARMHDIEFRAQRIQADKLRLANESDKVYNTYLEALDAQKLQYKTIMTDGSIEFRDANLKIMENRIVPGYTGETAYETLFIEDPSGKMVVTPEVATKYHLTTTGTESSDMDTYIRQVTGKDKKERPVMGTHDVTDPNVVADFIKVDNTNTTPITNNVFNPVDNAPGSANVVYDNFQDMSVIDAANTSGATEITGSTTSLSSGQKYTISTLEGFKKFLSLANSSNTASSTFILTSDITWDGSTCTGISSFSGTLNGNGHVIENLSGTQGLVKTVTSSGVIKNIGIRNGDIHGSGNDIAAFAGKLDGGKIENCFFTGTVQTVQTGDNGYHIGVFVGDNENGGTVQNCNADADVIGFGCVGGISGHNSGNLLNCNMKGSVRGGWGRNGDPTYDQTYTNWVGGICGHNNGTTVIKDCYTCAVIDYYYDGVHSTSSYNRGNPGGIVIGEAEHPENLTISNVTYSTVGNESLSITNSGTFGTTGTFKEYVDTPSVNPSDNYSGGFYSNIYGALVKSGMKKSDINEASVRSYVQALYTSEGGALKIANINDWLYRYTQNPSISGGSGFITALKNDINTGTPNQTLNATYHTTYTSAEYIANVPTDTSDAWDTDGSVTPGVVTCPTKENIAKELYYALKKAGKSVTEENVNAFIACYHIDTSLEDQWYLANLSHQIYLENDLNCIYNKVMLKQQYQNTSLYNADGDYTYSFSNTTPITYTPGTSPEEYQVGTEEYWDTSDPEIANAMIMWKIAQRGVIVATEEQATSKDYLINMLQAGSVLSTFDPSKVDSLKGLTEQQIKDMDDYEYNKLLGIEHTSVAVETSLREVSNEENLKKAEAQYEADMKKIDRKDARYDAQLAVCDNERNAIKAEMETLKNVAKDNVDRTFKLFS